MKPWKAAILALVAVLLAAVAQGDQCSAIEEDIDYYGNDIRSTNQFRADDCCNDCSLTPNCVMFVWSNGTCWLKYSPQGTRSRSFGKRAGFVHRATQCSVIMENKDYIGGSWYDLAKTLQSRAEACCSDCAATYGCAAWVWYNDTVWTRNGVTGSGTCYLKSKGYVHDNSTMSRPGRRAAEYRNYVPTLGPPPSSSYDSSSSYSSSSNSTMNVILIVVGVIGVFAGCAFLCIKVSSEVSANYPNAPLTTDTPRQLQPEYQNLGRRRQDIDNKSEHLWRCGICWFDSPSDKGACMLCESDRGTSFESPSDLNAVQHSAWARNQWVRTFDHVNDVAMWKQRPTHATTCADYFFVIASSNVITDDDDDACQCLTWQPLTRETSAAATLSGESLLSSWFLDDADDTGVPSVVPFQEKFATSLIHWTHTVASVTKIKVHRDTVWPESVAALVEIRAASKTKVVFLGEEGVDAGGVQREWYSLLSQAFLDNGLFIEHDNRSLGLNPLYAADPMHFVVLGRFLGRAIIDGQVLPFSLTVPLFKTLLGYPVSIEDIRYIDDTTYTSLVYVRDTADVGALALDFTWTLPDGTSVELMQGGSDVAVTEANQAEYVAALVRFWLLDAVQGPLALVVRGFYNVLSPDVMFRFDYKELELILCGTSEINIVEWQFETVATSDLTASPALGWFWDVVERDMQPHDRAKLLQFTTGSSRVPLQGFRALTGNDGQLCPFNLKGVPYTKGALPKVHTCFNRIVLPLYPSRYLMHEALFVLVNMEVKEFTMK